MPHLSWNEVRDRAIRFSREHAGDRSESAEKQTFWNDFFLVFGLRRASLASFEENVRNIKGNKGAIDLLWKGRLLVEHKSFGEDLGYAKTQAFDYIGDLTREQRWDEIPRFVLVSDFAQFVLYDLEPEEQRDLPLFDGRKIQPHHFTLADFPKNIRSFAFMLGQTRVRLDPEDPANEKAYRRMCELHDALLAGGFASHELERLLVRILFCMFAEDTAIFAPDVFTQFIRTQTREDGADCGARLNELFDWLNDPRADGALADTDPFYGFRYVNGGLFAERLGFPRFNREMRRALLDCCDFQWARISPAVFGSLFQGVMQDRARRQQGAHYTSERDIMKVLRSLFLDELRAEWTRLCADRSTRRRAGLEGFHQKLRSLQFLDPACGCGNFLVLAYRELRALEIEVVRELAAGSGGQQLLPIVNVDQFHGIEYAEWPVRIAEVALWLMDHQMNAQAGEVFGQPLDRLPLTSSPHIVQANALRVDWNTVLPREQCSYVMGNPPFVGKHYQSAEQRADMVQVFGDFPNTGDLDYVTCWYVKAARYITGGESITCGAAVPSPEGSKKLAGGVNPRIFAGDESAPAGAGEAGGILAPLRGASVSEAGSGGSASLHHRLISFGPAGPQSTAASPRVAFVSTNSITQGEQVPVLWSILFQRYHLKIHFAHRTFAWASEARGKAHVHVVIIGLAAFDVPRKFITDYDADPAAPVVSEVANITPYLTPGSDAFVTKQRQPLADVPEMRCGSKPSDGGALILTDAERAEFLRAEPGAERFLRRFTGSEEFINGSMRWCLWLKDAAPGELRKLPRVMERIERVRAFRAKSSAAPTRKAAATPALFFYISQPATDYILIPEVSSERRPYIPIGFVSRDIISANTNFLIPSSDVFLFGVLTSAMHMAWMRTVGGRLESRYRYSGSMVYNNFPWPNPTPAQRARVKTAAQAVLAARAPHLPPRGLSTLADLYDPLTMPAPLAKAHADLDRAVEKCYRAEAFHADRERVEHLFRLYEQLTAPLLPATPKTRHRRAQPGVRDQSARRGRTPGQPEA